MHGCCNVFRIYNCYHDDDDNLNLTDALFVE